MRRQWRAPLSVVLLMASALLLASLAEAGDSRYQTRRFLTKNNESKRATSSVEVKPASTEPASEPGGASRSPEHTSRRSQHVAGSSSPEPGNSSEEFPAAVTDTSNTPSPAKQHGKGKGAKEDTASPSRTSSSTTSAPVQLSPETETKGDITKKGKGKASPAASDAAGESPSADSDTNAATGKHGKGKVKKDSSMPAASIKPDPTSAEDSPTSVDETAVPSGMGRTRGKGKKHAEPARLPELDPGPESEAESESDTDTAGAAKSKKRKSGKSTDEATSSRKAAPSSSSTHASNILHTVMAPAPEDDEPTQDLESASGKGLNSAEARVRETESFMEQERVDEQLDDGSSDSSGHGDAAGDLFQPPQMGSSESSPENDHVVARSPEL